MTSIAAYEAVGLALFLWAIWDSWRQAGRDTVGDAAITLVALLMAWPLLIVVIGVGLLRDNWDKLLWPGKRDAAE